MTGYESKKAAARDRMLDDDDALTIAYQSGYYDGKKAAQPAQEPVAWLCSPDENGLFELPTTHKACKDCFPVYTAPPQSKQELVANDRALQLVTYQMNHWRAYALELQERLVKYEGGAPMLLNKEKNT